MRTFHLILLAVLLLSFSAQARILTVPQPYSTIQTAINSSSYNDTVLVERGTYRESIRSGARSLTFASRYLLTQDTADIAATVLTLPDSLLSDTTQPIQSILSDPVCGAIHLIGITFRAGRGTLQNSVRKGGAVFLAGTSVTIDHCVFLENSADIGSAVFLTTTGNSYVTNSQFLNNQGTSTTAYSGALNVTANGATISDCEFRSNRAEGDGGALVASVDTTGVLAGCTFLSNFANQNVAGAHLTNFDTVRECRFERNASLAFTALYWGVNSPVNATPILLRNQFINNETTEFPQSLTHATPGVTLYSNYTALSESWTIQENNFYGNRAPGTTNSRLGGALRLSILGNARIIRNDFVYNSGARGSAIYVENPDRVTIRIDSNRFYRNQGYSTISMRPFATSQFSVRYNDLIENSGYSLENRFDFTISADHNYWGSATGPVHANNPTGTGGTVTNGVSFAPFQTAPWFPPTSIKPDEPGAVLLAHYGLLDAFPNPANGGVTITWNRSSVYRVGSTGGLNRSKQWYELKLYNITGQLVRALPIPVDEAGMTSVVKWDGLTTSGAPVPTGIYFATLSGVSGVRPIKIGIVR